jgi:hypothetical protein
MGKNLQYYLEQISLFEKGNSKISFPAFMEMIKEIPGKLDGAYKVRFSKLKFYEKVESDSTDDIPF